LHERIGAGFFLSSNALFIVLDETIVEQFIEEGFFLFNNMSKDAAVEQRLANKNCIAHGGDTLLLRCEKTLVNA
jgi:hypothetical protein